jgi:glutamate-1-semialdehyde aminotransferase
MQKSTENKNFKKSNEYRLIIHDLIPGGAHTYSKGDDQFPQLSPAAIDYGKGAYVWDIDGNKYLDCSMGLTSVSLGHAYEPVLEAVKRELDRGVNFQRPSVLEKEMAETFLSLVPQHDMIKFAKNGSIVTTAAVKLARAYTGKKLVAFPADHPFYSYDDWFIGTTPCSLGVPEEIQQLSVKFNSCDIGSLRELFQKYPGQIACVITEPEKNTCSNGCSCDHNHGAFLKEAIDLAHENGALFVIDEMVSGFKSDFPGSMTKYNLNPDMATWGKGIANGFSFCALTGSKKIMQFGGINRPGEEKVFLISTTHGGETHSMAAALATIKVFKDEHVVAHNQQLGDTLIKSCKQLVEKYSLNSFIEIMPCNWLVGFNFYDGTGKASSPLRTLAMQEMIRHGVLFQGAFAPCLSHTINDIEYFTQSFNKALSVLEKAIKEGVGHYLIGEPAKSVFRKYS